MNNSQSCTIDSIKFIQHNANRQDIAHHTILQMALESSTDILLLQEPYCPRNIQKGSYIELQHPSFHLITPQPIAFQDNIAIRPRVFIYIRKASMLTFSPRYDIFNDPDIQAIEIHSQETFLIYNIYNEKQQNTGLTQQAANQHAHTFDRLLLSTTLHQPTLIAGDFNLHHPLWNSAANLAKARKAKKLVDWLDTQNAGLLLDPEVTNIHGGTYFREGLRTMSIIDLAFIAKFTKTYWSNWRYMEPSGSDHMVIAFEASYSQQHSRQFADRLPLYNYKSADWAKFDKELKEKEPHLKLQLDDYLLATDYDSIARSLTDAILDAANKSIPKLKVCEKSKPWWTPKIAELRKAFAKAYKKHRKYPENTQLLDSYKVARNIYFNSIRQAKQKCWEDFLQNAVKKDIFKAYSYTKSRQTTLLPTIRYGEDKQAANSFQEKCKAFLTTLYPKPPQNTQATNTPQSQILPLELNQYSISSKATSSKYKWEWPEINDSEVKQAIFSFTSTAPGPDTISATLIQKAFKSIPSIISMVYKTLFSAGYHPEIWRTCIGIILPKVDKKDYSDLKSYRVISLLNCLGKVLEKIFATRLNYLANTTTLLHDSQIGGRKQRSAIDAALLLTNYIEKQRLSRKIASNTITSTVFLDIKGGFDNVTKEKITAILNELCMPKELILWVSSFMTNRKIQLAFDSQIQQPVDLDIGTPQGSPISAILFLILIRDLVADNAFQLSYIDDFSLSASSTSAKKNCKRLQKAVKRLTLIGEKYGVYFNPSKTELIHFSTHRSPETASLRIHGREIKPKPLVRWLGIWFDSKLSFKQHIEKRVNLATAAFNSMQRLSHTQKRLSFQALRQLYNACITTIADYGTPVWYKDKSQVLLKQYQQLQNQALVKMLGAFKNSPIKALELEAAIPPPKIRFQRACLNYSLRTVYFNSNHPIRQAYKSALTVEIMDSESDSEASTNSGLSLYAKAYPTTQLLGLLSRLKGIVDNNWNIERHNLVWLAPWAQMPDSLEISISDKDKQQAKKEHLDLLEYLTFQECALYYTDGSQGTFQGQRTNSCSFCEIQEDRLISTNYWNLGPCIEVADAELIAIAKALDYIDAKLNTPPLAYIFVDSQAAITKIKGYTEIAANIRQKIHNLANRGTKIYIHWCPSHVGIYGNEVADKLAKTGLQQNHSENPPYISLSYIRRRIKESCINSWENIWLTEEENEANGKKAKGLGKHYRKIIRNSQGFSFKPRQLKGLRSTQSAYIQLKLGIGYLKTYQKAIGNIPTNLCQCGKKQTATHLILECVEYNIARAKMIKDMRTGNTLTMQILFNTIAGRKALYEFLTSTKVCTAKWYRNV